MANMVVLLGRARRAGRLGRARRGRRRRGARCASTPRPRPTPGSRRRPTSRAWAPTAIRWIPTDAELRMDVDALRRRSTRTSPPATCRCMVVGTGGLGQHRRGRSAAARSPRSAGSTASGSTSTAPTAASPRRCPSASDDLRGAGAGRLGGGRSAQVALRAARGGLRARARRRARCATRSPTIRPTTTSTERAAELLRLGPQNSRGFRALKVWLALRQVGRGRVRAHDRATTSRCRAAMADAVRAHPELELCTQALSITTFRYVPPTCGPRVGEPAVEAYLDTLNRDAARPAAARRRGVRVERRRRRPLPAARLHRQLPHDAARTWRRCPTIVVRVGRQIRSRASLDR